MASTSLIDEPSAARVPASADGHLTPTHLYELVRLRSQKYPSAVAFGSQQGLRWKAVNSREFLDLVDSLAHQLSAVNGVREGDRVVTWLPNHWRTPVFCSPCGSSARLSSPSIEK